MYNTCFLRLQLHSVCIAAVEVQTGPEASIQEMSNRNAECQGIGLQTCILAGSMATRPRTPYSTASGTPKVMSREGRSSKVKKERFEFRTRFRACEP
jgi:hypothetical protein